MTRSERTVRTASLWLARSRGLVLWLTGEDILIPNGSLLAIEVDEPKQGSGKVLWQISHNSDQIKRTSSFFDQF